MLFQCVKLYLSPNVGTLLITYRSSVAFTLIFCLMGVFLAASVLYTGGSFAASVRDIDHFLNRHETGIITSVSNQSGVASIMWTTADKGAITVYLDNNSVIWMCKQDKNIQDIQGVTR